MAFKKDGGTIDGSSESKGGPTALMRVKRGQWLCGMLDTRVCQGICQVVMTTVPI